MNLIVNVETDHHHLLCKLRKKKRQKKKKSKSPKKNSTDSSRHDLIQASGCTYQAQQKAKKEEEK